MEKNTMDNKLARSTKICIAVIVVLLLGSAVGGYQLYNYAYDQGCSKAEERYDEGYTSGYNKGYDKGYRLGKNAGYDSAMDANEQSSASTSETTSDTNTSYMTTDSAPDGVVWVTRYGDKYHKSYCRYISGKNNLSYFDSAADAENSGYSACSVCY